MFLIKEKIWIIIMIDLKNIFYSMLIFNNKMKVIKLI